MAKQVRKASVGYTTFCIPTGLKLGVGARFRSTAPDGRYVDLRVTEMLDEHSAIAEIVGYGHDLLAAA